MTALSLSEEIRLELLKEILRNEAAAGTHQAPEFRIAHEPFLPADPMIRLQTKVNAMHDIVFGRAIQPAPDRTGPEQPQERSQGESGC